MSAVSAMEIGCRAKKNVAWKNSKMPITKRDCPR
jgi:hypothetical protein